MSVFQRHFELLHRDPRQPPPPRPGAHHLPQAWIDNSAWFRRYPEVAPPAPMAPRRGWHRVETKEQP